MYIPTTEQQNSTQSRKVKVYEALNWLGQVCQANGYHEKDAKAALQTKQDVQAIISIHIGEKALYDFETITKKDQNVLAMIVLKMEQAKLNHIPVWEWKDYLFMVQIMRKEINVPFSTF